MAPILTLSECKGILTLRELRLEVAFETKVENNGEVSFDFAPIPVSNETRFLSQKTEPFLLEGHCEGVKLRTESGYFTTFGTKATPESAHWTLKGSTFGLDVDFAPNESSSQCNSIQYFVTGLRYFRTPILDTEFGPMSIMGEPKPSDFSRVNGIISFDFSGKNLPDLAAVDSQVERLLEILSLANGRIIGWSFRKLYKGSEGLGIHFRGPKVTTQPAYPLMHFLDLLPIIKVALENYSPELRSCSGLGTAISWSLVNSQFVDVDYLACMTALEHLLDMRQAKNRLGRLNRDTFRNKLNAYLDNTGVPMDDLRSSIPKLIRLRNEIVHEGLGRTQSSDQLVASLKEVREILCRIFLKLLGFRGRYISCIDGRDRKFG